MPIDEEAAKLEMLSIYSDYPLEENQKNCETLMVDAEVMSSSEDEHFETLR